MALKNKLILAGIVCSLSTTQFALADGAIPSKSPKTTNSSPGGNPGAATRPPLLLAPSLSAKPLQTLKSPPPKAVENKEKILKTAKLSSNAPQLLKSPTPAQGDPRLSASKGSANEILKADFVSLLRGKGLQGWVVHEGQNSVWAREGDTISCQGAGGGWLRTEKEFSDFHLKFEYRYQPGCNTGLGIRCPSEGNPTFTGIEIQLLDDKADKYKNLRAEQYTGSVYYQVAPSQKPKLNATGQWNQCEVICLGDQLTIQINGETVNEVNLAKSTDQNKTSSAKKWKLAERPPVGHLALQSHSSKVDFRNLLVKDLSVGTASGVRFTDIAEGEGEPLSDASIITIHYVGQLLNGTRFGDTRDFGEPVTVALDDVIEGWKHGIVGMKVGGRRRLIVPPEMAYGSQGVENLIPPDSTLVFEVELRGFER